MQTELSHLTDEELVQQVYVTGAFQDWPAVQKELFYRMRDKHDRLRAAAEQRAQLQSVSYL